MPITKFSPTKLRAAKDKGQETQKSQEPKNSADKLQHKIAENNPVDHTNDVNIRERKNDVEIHKTPLTEKPMKPARPTEPNKPAKHAKPTKPAKPAKPFEPVRPVGYDQYKHKGPKT